MPMDHETESTLRDFREAHQRRIELMYQGDGLAPDDAAMREERDAICRHAEVLRAHAARLARYGR